ncbi:MAG: small ribosomal subunit biogenesis GTPase RsgA [Magnetococcales bacterium]|nr:small ribosomal subunit biogenesis GTPase RsgA [Magnetococcales bacterium]
MPRKKSSRTINHRQKERISAIRQRRSDRINARQEEGWEILNESTLGSPEEGLVIAHFGLNVEVENQQGGICRCAVRETAGIEPVCGDRVVWQRANPDQGVITAVIDRHSTLQRPGPYRRLKTIAANIDQIFITTTSNHLNTGLLDRYLVAAEAAEIIPILLINKMDLAQNPEELMEQMAPYRAMNYQILAISATTGLGMSELEQLLTEKTSIFVGQSGVGKSSLVRHWVPEKTAPAIGEVNHSTGKGRQTTTVARLYHLENGGTIIDSPGIREFGLHNISKESVASYFRDIAPYLQGCRFSNCSHSHEPGCRVLSAIKDGKIDIIRLKSLHRIQESLEKSSH